MENIVSIKEAIQERDFDKLKKLTQDFQLPNSIKIEELKALLHEVLNPLLFSPYPEYKPENYNEISVKHWAEQQINELLFDRCQEQRQWQRESLERAVKRGVSLTAFLDRYIENGQPISDDPEAVLQQIADHYGYPPIIQLTDDVEELYQVLKPYFQNVQKQLKDNPFAHLSLSWNVLISGQSVTRKVFLNILKIRF
jgi:hypothetical protein